MCNMRECQIDNDYVNISSGGMCVCVTKFSKAKSCIYSSLAEPHHTYLYIERYSRVSLGIQNVAWHGIESVWVLSLYCIHTNMAHIFYI